MSAPKVTPRKLIECDVLNESVPESICLLRHFAAKNSRKKEFNPCKCCPEVIKRLSNSQLLKYRLFRFLKRQYPKFIYMSDLCEEFNKDKTTVGLAISEFVKGGIVQVEQIFRKGVVSAKVYRIVKDSDVNDSL